jgi:phospholipase C
MSNLNTKKDATTPSAMNQNIVNNIKYVVVMMMENRSFDHILGAFPGVNGIDTSNPYYNLSNPAVNSGTQYQQNPVNVDSQPQPPPTLPQFDPYHCFGAMMTEVYGPLCTGYLSSAGGAITGYIDGVAQPLNPATDPYYPNQTMCGYYSTNGPEQKYNGAMSYFEYLPPGTSGRLNVLHTLAENFVVCDNWFCDTPSETFPNRFFVHAATNMGYNDDNNAPSATSETDLWGANTLYAQLDQIIGPVPGQPVPNWYVYGWPGGTYNNEKLNAAQFDSDWFEYCHQAPKSQYNRDISNFTADVAAGMLPFYSFLMPSLNFPQSGDVGNSMHPNCDVRLGENYIAQVYNALRNSNIWNNTLLIITFDENGGIYDHETPWAPATPPDSITYPVDANGNPASNPLFDYSVLGPRIPAILVSPWLANPNGSNKPFTASDAQVDSTQYQNTTIPRFVQDLCEAQNNGNSSIGGYFLTQRDLNANSIANSPFWLTKPSPGPQITVPAYTGNDMYGNPIAPWGTCRMIDPNCTPTNLLEMKPTETAMHFARGYLYYYPGHPDSGKPLTREFKTNLELLQYMDERKKAARNYALQGKPALSR